MSFQVQVELKGSSTLIYSDEYEAREQAEAELGKVREAIGRQVAPEVTWMAALGSNVLGAQIIETGGPLIA